MSNQELLKYIQTQIAQSSNRLNGYTRDSQGRELHKRSIYLILEKYVGDFLKGTISDPRIIIMPGLRGTGKTTLLAQIFLNQISSGVDKLYISADEVVKRFDTGLWELLEHYEKLVGSRLEELKQPLVLFFDEIHYDRKWAAFLKSIYDRSKKVMVICTGSAALLLREQVNADIARRAVFVDVHPVNFIEYLLLKNHKYPVKGLSEELREALLLPVKAESVFKALKELGPKVNGYWKDIDNLEIQRYVKLGTFPFTIHFDNETLALDYVGQMLNKVAYTDVPQFASFDFETLKKIEKILYLLSFSVGTSVANLSDTIETKANQVHDLLDALVKAGILNRVLPFGGHFKQVRKPSKYLFATPALRYYFLSSRDSVGVFQNYQGYLFEDIVAMYFNRTLKKFGGSSLTYDVAEGGADFIVTRADRKAVWEVGVGENNKKQVIQSMKKIEGHVGIVLHSGELSLDQENNIISVPWKLFLLM